MVKSLVGAHKLVKHNRIVPRMTGRLLRGVFTRDPGQVDEGVSPIGPKGAQSLAGEPGISVTYIVDGTCTLQMGEGGSIRQNRRAGWGVFCAFRMFQKTDASLPWGT